MPAIPPHVPLQGRHVWLDPMTEANLGELYAAIGRPETFEHGYGGGPAAAGVTASPEAFADFCRGYFPFTGGLPYLVRLAAGPQAGTCVGTSSVAEFVEPTERCHLGWTAYHASVQGTVVNPECKLLLLGHVFDHGWGRVRIQADAVNQRSRRAIAKLGATFEGITRRDQRRADGTWRDAAVFSIIVGEWPSVRDALQRRVDAWEGPLSTEPSR